MREALGLVGPDAERIIEGRGGPRRGTESFPSMKSLKVSVLHCLATVCLCALTGSLDHAFHFLAQSIGEISSGHHVHTFEKFLDLGCNDVTHGEYGGGK